MNPLRPALSLSPVSDSYQAILTRNVRETRFRSPYTPESRTFYVLYAPFFSIIRFVTRTSPDEM